MAIACRVAGEGGRELVIRRTYAEAVWRAGGLPVHIGPAGASDPIELAEAHAHAFDAYVLTGGDDPDMTEFGKPNHPLITLEHPTRQTYDTALLRALDRDRPRVPVLGVCWGMQIMALLAGADLIQHMPDELESAADHTNDARHPIVPALEHPVIVAGEATSHHHQAMREDAPDRCGSLRVVARAHDGVVEAIDDPTRPFCLGVQWHPERTKEDPLGLDVFRALVRAARDQRN